MSHHQPTTAPSQYGPQLYNGKKLSHTNNPYSKPDTPKDTTPKNTTTQHTTNNSEGSDDPNMITGSGLKAPKTNDGYASAATDYNRFAKEKNLPLYDELHPLKPIELRNALMSYANYLASPNATTKSGKNRKPGGCVQTFSCLKNSLWHEQRFVDHNFKDPVYLSGVINDINKRATAIAVKKGDTNISKEVTAIRQDTFIKIVTRIVVRDGEKDPGKAWRMV